MATLATHLPVIAAGLQKLLNSWVDPHFLNHLPGLRDPSSPFGEEPILYPIGGATPALGIVVEGDPFSCEGTLALIYTRHDPLPPGKTWTFTTEAGEVLRLGEPPAYFLERLTPALLRACVEAACWEAFYKLAPVDALFTELVRENYRGGTAEPVGEEE